ncbi:helix-turn-helix domain-containing protein [Pedobacter sp. PWIIR3]
MYRLLLFRLILNIAAKVMVCAYVMCRNLYGLNRNMFKAEIRRPEEILLKCIFEPTDYPLVNVRFGENNFKKRLLKWPDNRPLTEHSKEDKYVIDIQVPEVVIHQMLGEQTGNDLEKSPKTNSERLSPQMRNIITDILHCSFKLKLKRAYLTTKVAELLIEILAVRPTRSSSKKWAEQDLKSFEKVKDLLGQNLKANHSIEELAILAGMNRTKLQEGFKDLYHKTIYNFTMDLKMTEAKALLTKDHNLSLKEVAMMLGYKHVNHFSVAFKKKFSISPAAFMKLLQLVMPFGLCF